MLSDYLGSLSRFFTPREAETVPSAARSTADTEDFSTKAFHRTVCPADVHRPEKLSPDGIYAIRLTQAEMYDLGNIEWIDRYFIFDRKTGIAVDVTSMIDQAPLLSARENAAEVPEQGRDSLEAWLSGRKRPEYCEQFPQGVKRFSASEIDSAQAPIFRACMEKVAEFRAGLNAAVRSLEQEVLEVRGGVLG